jgi:hypothetical protein
MEGADRRWSVRSDSCAGQFHNWLASRRGRVKGAAWVADFKSSYPCRTFAEELIPLPTYRNVPAPDHV